MDLNLSGKVAIVTGASRGIGRSIAQTLSAEGVKLTLAARSALDEFCASLPTENLPLSIDMRQADSASRAVNATLEKFGAFDLVVNNNVEEAKIQMVKNLALRALEIQKKSLAQLPSSLRKNQLTSTEQ